MQEAHDEDSIRHALPATRPAQAHVQKHPTSWEPKIPQKEETKHSDPSEDLEVEMIPDENRQLETTLPMADLSMTHRQSVTLKFLETPKINKVLSSPTDFTE
jgi:hypothetical protein